MKKHLETVLWTVILAFLVMGCGEESTGGEQSLTLKIVEISEHNVVADAVEDVDIYRDSLPRYSFGTSELDDIGAEAGDIVDVIYTGEVMETWPMQIQVVSWSVKEKASETDESLTVDAQEEEDSAEKE